MGIPYNSARRKLPTDYSKSSFPQKKESCRFDRAFRKQFLHWQPSITSPFSSRSFMLPLSAVGLRQFLPTLSLSLPSLPLTTLALLENEIRVGGGSG